MEVAGANMPILLYLKETEWWGPTFESTLPLGYAPWVAANGLVGNSTKMRVDGLLIPLQAVWAVRNPMKGGSSDLIRFNRYPYTQSRGRGSRGYHARPAGYAIRACTETAYLEGLYSLSGLCGGAQRRQQPGRIVDSAGF